MDAWLVHNVNGSLLRLYRLGNRSILGRGETSLVPLSDRAVWPSHCVIWREQNSYRIRDLTGCQGTLVNYQYVPETTLVTGDQVMIGEQSFSFRTHRSLAQSPRKRAKILHLEKYRPGRGRKSGPPTKSLGFEGSRRTL